LLVVLVDSLLRCSLLKIVSIVLFNILFNVWLLAFPNVNISLQLKSSYILYYVGLSFTKIVLYDSIVCQLCDNLNQSSHF